MVPGWRRKLIQAVLLCVAFVLPIIGFSLREYVVVHQFSLAPAAGGTIYGRLAESADCATLKLPPYERAVCPSRALAIRLGPDGLVHSDTSPDHTYVAPPGHTHGEVIGNFEHRVITQQSLRVAGGVLGDAARLFELHRVTSTGDTPISRWQFQTSYPTYDGSIFLSRDHTIMLGLHFASSGGPVQIRPLPPPWADGPRWPGRWPDSCAATSCTAAIRRDRCSRSLPWRPGRCRDCPGGRAGCRPRAQHPLAPPARAALAACWFSARP